MTPDMPKDVAAVFVHVPDNLKPQLLRLRETIFWATELSDVGTVVETLKWGEMSYLPKRPRVGTTLRIGASEVPPQLRLFVPCQTRLLDIYRTRFPGEFTYVDNRAVHLNPGDLDNPALVELAALALTYHRDRLAA